jgi:hypothetical protein
LIVGRGWSAVGAGVGGVAAGVDEVVDGGAAVVAAPGDRELGGPETGDGDAGESRAGVDGGVAFGEQDHGRAGVGDDQYALLMVTTKVDGPPYGKLTIHNARLYRFDDDKIEAESARATAAA